MGKSKVQMRAEAAALVEDFLKKGGQVTKLDAGEATGDLDLDFRSTYTGLNDVEARRLHGQEYAPQITGWGPGYKDPVTLRHNDRRGYFGPSLSDEMLPPEEADQQDEY